jgi:hypothetical protein
MKFLDVRPELVAELAMGVEDPQAVAARYGVEGEAWDELQKWKPFIDAIAAQKAEFDKNGYTFRVKSAMKADVLADRVFVQALTNEATFLQKVEALKLFTKLGDLEPNPKASVPAGPAFSITIDLGGGQKTLVEVKPSTVAEVEEATYVDAEPELVTADGGDSESVDRPVLGDVATNVVSGFKVPDFDLTPKK